MRILFYNWADILDAEKRGGGVSVYQRALVETLSADPAYVVATLCAGLHHDLSPRAPRIERLGDAPCPRYALINSGVVAPSHAMFDNPRQLSHPPTEAAFARFLDDTGPWDVIHFNTLEGLPAEVIQIASDHLRQPGRAPGKLLYSLHNYYPFCPQVNLWHAETEHCADFNDGARCVSCLPKLPNPAVIRASYQLGDSMERVGMGPGSMAFDRVLRPSLRMGLRTLRRVAGLRHSVRHAVQRARSPQPRKAPPPAQVPPSAKAAHFRQRRARMVELLNAHCDHVICVSDRVRQIAVAHGVNPELAVTRYIGTSHAVQWQRTAPRAAFPMDPARFTMTYLGYMRRDKGFYFLLNALRGLPAADRARLHLIVAAKRGDPEAMQLLDSLRPLLGALTHVDGYTHDGLDDLLAPVDLGVVPVLWEDNLPQVALEMHARHIPILTADRGGAQELALSPDFVFRAGDGDDFTTRLSALMNGATDPAPLWDGAFAPLSMDQHIEQMQTLFGGAG